MNVLLITGGKITDVFRAMVFVSRNNIIRVYANITQYVAVRFQVLESFALTP